MQLKHYFFAFLFIILFIPLQAQNFVNETPAEVAVEYSKDLQALLGLNDTELKKVEKIHVKYFRKKERFRYNKTPKHKRIKAIKKRDKAMKALLSDRQYQLYKEWLNEQIRRNKGQLKSV